METSVAKGGTAIQKLIESLIKKRANLKDWIQKANDFYRVRDLESFEELLQNAITHGYKTYAGYKDDLLKIYTMLAGHFVRLISKSLGGPHSEWQAKLSSIVLAMDELKIGLTDAQFLLCRGFALMVTNTRLAEADQCFATVLQRIPHNVAALLGRSCLAYQRQDYRLALGHIKSVFYNFPQGPADVRVAMGHCFLKIGNFDSARRAFEVAVSSNGHSLNALLGIAHLKLRKRQQAATKDAVNLLCAAFEMDSQHPLVLTWLAVHFYYSHDYEKMKSAAGTAYRLTDSPQLKAQNCFQIARGLHVNRNYEDAFAFYRKAVTHSPAGYVLPYLGLAQMCVRLNRLDEAEVALRTLLRALPDQTQALRILAALYAQRDDPAAQDMAIQLFRKAQREDDYCSHLNLADIYQRKQLWQDAIDCYDKAMSTHRRLHSTHNLPINWLNNVAALQMHLNQPKAALRTLDKALAMRDDASQEYWQSNMLTLRFNRARVLEALHLEEQAAQSYTQLISEYPSYCDSYVRLGHMANKRNLINAFENAEVPDFDIPDEILDMLTQHLKKSKGCYMSIAVANLCVIKAQRLKAMGKDITENGYLKQALSIYHTAFQANERNVWAANGLGVVLCITNQMKQGQTIFRRIVKSGNKCPEAILNYANVALELNNYKKAIARYLNCFQLLPQNYHVKVMHFLAKTYFQTGQVTESKQWLLKARHLAPHKMMLLYNLSITIKQECGLVFASKSPETEEFKRAKRDIKQANRFFEYLGNVDESFHLAKKLARKCKLLRFHEWKNEDNNIDEEPAVKRRKKEDREKENSNSAEDWEGNKKNKHVKEIEMGKCEEYNQKSLEKMCRMDGNENATECKNSAKSLRKSKEGKKRRKNKTDLNDMDTD